MFGLPIAMAVLINGCRLAPGMEECGNGWCAEGEICARFHGERLMCHSTLCGDHKLDPGEECDDGDDNGNGSDACSSTCSLTCGISVQRTPATGILIATGASDPGLSGDVNISDGNNTLRLDFSENKLMATWTENRIIHSSSHDLLDQDGSDMAGIIETEMNKEINGNRWLIKPVRTANILVLRSMQSSAIEDSWMSSDVKSSGFGVSVISAGAGRDCHLDEPCRVSKDCEAPLTCVDHVCRSTDGS